MKKKLKKYPELEQAFKDWETENNSQSTARTYWQRIQNFPYFELRNNSQREIIGMLNKRLKKTEQKTAISRFIVFLYEEWEKDDVSDEEYTDLQIKKNAVKSNLNVPEKEKNKSNDVDPKEHWMYKDELVSLLRVAEPNRAKLYYLLYAGGFRIGEIKRLTHAHLRRDYGENGAAKVVSERSKSDKDRMVKFRSDLPLKVFDSLETGTWESDENDEAWDDVFFPELYSENEYYYLSPRKYCGEIGVGQRSSHSFRHIRTTDLVKATSMDNDVVERRHGWVINSGVINNYVEFVPDRVPQTLEQYCRDNSIDLWSVINS